MANILHIYAISFTVESPAIKPDMLDVISVRQAVVIHFS